MWSSRNANLSKLSCAVSLNMLVFVLFFYFVHATIAQQQYGAGLLDNLFVFPKYCLCRCGMQRRGNSWLSGGEPVSTSQFPWLVTVKAGDEYVSGSLITDRHVITAASPLYSLPASNISVILGSRDSCDRESGLTSNIESIALHPDFSHVTLDSNIALIRLRYVVPFDDSISPICMPFQGSRETGKVAYTVSYGNSTCLGHVVSLPVLSGRQCLVSSVNVSLITADKGCLGPVASLGVLCKGDVGAPVMTQWLSGTSFHLIGVISEADCEKVTTALYTRVADHASWINRQIRSACQCYSKFR